MNPGFEQNHSSRTAKGFQRSGHNTIRSMKRTVLIEFKKTFNSVYGSVFSLLQQKYLNIIYYVEVKDKRYIIHPAEKPILREREEPIF